MSGRGSAKRARGTWTVVWLRRTEGLGQKRIAKALGLSQSTVRYYLDKGPPPGFGVLKPGVKAVPVVAPRSSTPKVAEVIPLRRAQ